MAGVQIAGVSSQDLGRAELYALPFLLLLLFFVFRGLRAAAVPLVGAVFAIAVTLGVMGLTLVLVPLSIFALNLVIALGIGLSVDFSLLIISRFREEFAREPSIDSALATVRRTAGHTVLFSALTIAAAIGTLAVFPERFVYSMGIAGAIVVLAAGAFALLVLPAILTVFGQRIAQAPPSVAQPVDGIATGRRWYGMATRVMRRPAIWGAASVLVIVVLASPFIKVAFTGADASSLPASSSAGAAYTLVQAQFPSFSEAPAGVLVDSSQVTPANLATYATAVAHVPGVKAVPVFQHLGGSLWESDVVLTAAPLSPTAQSAVEAMQALPGPGPGHVTVIGQTASFLSLQHSLKVHLPIVLGLIILIALVMLFAMTRSVTLPLMAVVMNFFTIAATYGVLVWGFQRGHLSHLLGFHTPEALQSTSLIIILAVVFGLSTDYGVFLLGRIKEEHDAGASPDEAVALGMAHTGGIVTAAACCLALALGALVLSRLVFVKEIGFGVAFAVILDATLVRAVMVPAVMKLLGAAAWWNPFSGRPTVRLASTPFAPAQPSAPVAVLGADVPAMKS